MKSTFLGEHEFNKWTQNNIINLLKHYNFDTVYVWEEDLTPTFANKLKANGIKTMLWVEFNTKSVTEIIMLLACVFRN